MRHAEIDEARLLTAGEHRARLAQELRRVLGDAQGIGADRAHALPGEAAQALGELRERLERRSLRRAVDALVRGEAAAEAHHFAHRVERVDLAIDHAPDLEVEAVRAEVDGRKGFLARHADYGNRFVIFAASREASIARIKISVPP